MKRLLFVLLLGLVSCDEFTNESRVKDFEYFKDTRTNLCFASYNLGMSYGVMTNVPCTEEVEKAIKADGLAHK